MIPPTVPKYQLSQLQNMVCGSLCQLWDHADFGNMEEWIISPYYVFIVRCCPDCGPDYRAVLLIDGSDSQAVV